MSPGLESMSRCRAKSAHIRQSRPDSGLGSQVKGLKPLKSVPLRSAADRREVTREQPPLSDGWVLCNGKRHWCLSAEQPAPAPPLANPHGCAALRIVLITVPLVSRSCELFPNGFDLYLLQWNLFLLQWNGKALSRPIQKIPPTGQHNTVF